MSIIRFVVLGLLFAASLGCGHKDIGISRDYILVKDGYPVATFYGFVTDLDACKGVAEVFNKEAMRTAYWCKRPE